MLQRLTHRARSEDGFTLVELLVVILIIGILAAIALPTFLGQSAKAQDAEAKSNARNAVSQVESCFTGTQNYTSCGNGSLTGLNGGTGRGQVNITGNSGTAGFTATAYSQSGNRFIIQKTSSGLGRTCETNNGGTADGGCNGSSW